MKKLMLTMLFVSVAGIVNAQDTTKQFICWMPIEQMPKFPGGDPALMQYLKHNVHYPKKCEKRGIQGNVYITFVINEKGRITKPIVVRSAHPLLDKEALRVVKRMPRWKPGTLNGKPTKVKYSVPIRFKLTPSEDNE